MMEYWPAHFDGMAKKNISENNKTGYSKVGKKMVG